ncbi:MAG: TOBE domain-containing protein, partial [Pseudomonadota bacterium]
GQTLALAADEAARGPATLALRQEDLAFAPDGLAGEVRARIYMGARSRTVVRVGAAEIRVLSGEAAAEPGARVHLTIPAERVLVIADAS